MRSVTGRLSALALLPVLATVTACGAAPLELQASDRLNGLLLTASDYPRGYTVEAVDVEDLEDTSPGSADLGAVDPAECASILGGGASELPDSAVEGAGQVASHGEDASVYAYILVSGDLGEDALDTTDYDAMLRECSEMTVTSEGLRMDATIGSLTSPALPETGGILTMSLEGEGMEMTMTTAWGQVDDVFFTLMLMGFDTASGPVTGLPSGDARDRCRDANNPVVCMREASETEAEEASEEARQRSLDEFEEVLSAAVAKLEQGV
ncbi:hypothetical protein NE857_18895 [Nocardiopsis exhalans]|uniref:Secreted protein n=1 Tax=Nocardiopsis exhalans TaxID=163604 RepID=A0ABY5D2R3_9ACTN|nr:hypothetical protein [Nocardiopsis exhalans]USY17411.1 hypothetical protein NE857_18895 [Nocardiopsis exhalans]